MKAEGGKRKAEKTRGLAVEAVGMEGSLVISDLGIWIADLEKAECEKRK